MCRNKLVSRCFQLAKKKKCSIYCLQDIHINEQNKTAFRNNWGSDIIYCGYSSESRGAMIGFGDQIDYCISSVHKDNKGNLLIIEMKVNKMNMILVVLYGPNKEDPNFYEELKTMLINKPNIPLIICGDWNLVLNFD